MIESPQKQGKIDLCVDYVLKVLLGEEFQQAKSRAKVVYDSPANVSGHEPLLCIVPSGFFGELYGTAQSVPRLPLKLVEGIPLLFGEPIIVRQENLLVSYADIIASTYFLVTRYEETVRPKVRDQHGRFPGTESLAFRDGFTDRPIVEEYTVLLKKWLSQIGVTVPQAGRSFSVQLTHDVDFLRRCTNLGQLGRSAGSAVLGRQSVSDAIWDSKAFLGLRKDRYDTFDELIQLDGSLRNRVPGTRTESVYFLMAQATRKCTYSVRSKLFSEVLATICDSDATVGLHASYEAGANPTLVAEEKQRLEEVCGFPIRRNRHHFLRWREVGDGWALKKAGITWDATLGYADVPGFRLGVCHPVELFDPVTIKPFGIEEHPLMLMDGTLNDGPFASMSNMELLELCRRLIRQTCKHEGEFVLLWHNTPSFRSSTEEHLSFYAMLLDELVQVCSGSMRPPDQACPQIPVFMGQPKQTF